MTNDLNLTITIAVSALAALGMVTTAALTGWRGWLQLKQQELAGRSLAGHASEPGPATSAAARIEMADLRERLRKLEAIAAGVDL